jgi:DNA-binding beta-propeller fold protein YncE
LIGVFSPDGKFKKISKLAPTSARRSWRENLRPAEVPTTINLHPREYIVQDYEPPAHAVRLAKRQSFMATLRDHLVTFAYGRENVLRAPTHVTTDSRQRLIVSDPELPAVHILDASGGNSFRIAGGPQHRLQKPNGVAVDAHDNIYVADGNKGLILVYDSRGRFIRNIGSFKGETLFQSPSGIAIDRQAGHLYVLDSPANQLVMLDLQGRILRKTGNKRSQANGVGLDYPAEIALGKDQLIILDSANSRIQVFDLQCNFQRAFPIRTVSGAPVITEIGLALDSSSNIYVSNLGGPTLRIYGQGGQLIGLLEGRSLGVEELSIASGLWIDPVDRIYVADTRNSQIHVLRISAQSDRTQGVQHEVTQSGR